MQSIEGCNGKFYATINGQIYSILNQGLINQRIDKNGYLYVNVYDGDKGSRSVAVHRLVARAFIGKRPFGMSVNHINGIKTDNRPENLEYCTPAENTKHAWQTGLIRPHAPGENHHRSSLTDRQRVNIEYLRRSGLSYQDLANMYERSVNCIRESVFGVQIFYRDNG